MKFNKKQSQTVENFEGGQAFAQSAKLEFISILLTSFVQDQFYRSESETVLRICELIDEIDDLKFVAKAAIYARTEFGTVSYTHLSVSVRA